MKLIVEIDLNLLNCTSENAINMIQHSLNAYKNQFNDERQFVGEDMPFIDDIAVKDIK